MKRGGKLLKKLEESRKVSANLRENEKYLRSRLENCSDILIRPMILLVIAFLISPMGLPLAAIWLLGKVQDLKFAIQDWMYG